MSGIEFVSSSSFSSSFVQGETEAGLILLPGFRFDPVDSELVLHCLLPFSCGIPLDPVDLIPVWDVYKHHPKKLPCNFKYGIGNELYFFTPRERKDEGGSRIKRSVDGGFWKTTSNDKPIKIGSDLIGWKKTFAFHEGKPEKSKKTGWIMHEYRLNDTQKTINGFVLCRIYRRTSSSSKCTEDMWSESALQHTEEDVKNDAPCSSSQNITSSKLTGYSEAVSHPHPFFDGTTSQNTCNIAGVEVDSSGDIMMNEDSYELKHASQNELVWGHEPFTCFPQNGSSTDDIFVRDNEPFMTGFPQNGSSTDEIFVWDNVPFMTGFPQNGSSSDDIFMSVEDLLLIDSFGGRSH